MPVLGCATAFPHTVHHHRRMVRTVHSERAQGATHKLAVDVSPPIQQAASLEKQVPDNRTSDRGWRSAIVNGHAHYLSTCRETAGWLRAKALWSSSSAASGVSMAGRSWTPLHEAAGDLRRRRPHVDKGAWARVMPGRSGTCDLRCEAGPGKHGSGSRCLSHPRPAMGFNPIRTAAHRRTLCDRMQADPPPTPPWAHLWRVVLCPPHGAQLRLGLPRRHPARVQLLGHPARGGADRGRQPVRRT